jgi:hypothetical protein
MTTPEIIAAAKHLKEMQDLGESTRLVERAQARLRDAESAAGVDDALTPPVELGADEPVVEASQNEQPIEAPKKTRKRKTSRKNA